MRLGVEIGEVWFVERRVLLPSSINRYEFGLMHRNLTDYSIMIELID